MKASLAENSMKITDSTLISASDKLYFEDRGEKILVVSPATGGYVVIQSGNSFLETLLKTINQKPHVVSDLIAGDIDKQEFFIMLASLLKRGLIRIDQYVFGTSSSSITKENRLLSPKSATNLYPVLGVFHVHNYCNLACKYCYTIEEGVSRQKLSPALMKKVVDDLIDLPTTQSTLEFHGGEPTMAYDEIREVVEYANRLFFKKKKNLFFAIQTNAFYLKPKMIEFLVKYHFRVRVSLDGTKETHDAARKTHGGQGSYVNVVSGIQQLQSVGINPNVICVVHNRNVDQLISMYDEIAKLEVAGVRFLPVFKSGKASESDWMTGETYYRAYFSLIRHIVDLGKSGQTVCKLPNLIAGELGAVSSFQRNYMCMRTPCGAGTNMIAVDTNGDLYPCEEMIGKAEFMIGNVEHHSLRECLDTHPLVERLKSRHVDHILDCKTCPWKQMCHGGCVHKSYTHFKRLDQKSEHCPYYKQIYRDLIWLEQDQPGAWDILRGGTVSP